MDNMGGYSEALGFGGKEENRNCKGLSYLFSLKYQQSEIKISLKIQFKKSLNH